MIRIAHVVVLLHQMTNERGQMASEHARFTVEVRYEKSELAHELLAPLIESDIKLAVDSG